MAALKKPLMMASANAVRTKLPTKVMASGRGGGSGYVLFGKDERPKLTGTPQEVMTELGSRWKALDDAAKKPYNDKALKLKNEAPKTGVEEHVLRVKGEAKLARLATQASNAAIQGFFSGLTDLTEAELKETGTSMSVTGTGSLKVVRKDDGKFEVTFTPRKPGDGSD